MTFEKEVTMSVGIVAERRRLDHPWADHSWRPVAVVPGLKAPPARREIASGEGWRRYLVGCLSITLHRKETEGYRENLASERPAIYIVLQQDDDDPETEIRAVLATVSPYDAQDYLDSGEDIVEPVTMPDEMIAWLEDFIAAHHVEETFKKRKRVPYSEDAPRFGKELHPIEARFYKQKGAKKPH
jgi:hypothetical protein